jgi:hypothetical protein
MQHYYNFSMKEISIKLHVQVFLMMNTWMFKTYRRHYNRIKTLM